MLCKLFGHKWVISMGFRVCKRCKKSQLALMTDLDNNRFKWEDIDIPNATEDGKPLPIMTRTAGFDTDFQTGVINPLIPTENE